MQTSILVIVVSVAALFGVVVGLSLRRRPGRRPSESFDLPPGQSPTDEQVKRLAREPGRKIEAIKRYRDIHKVGLKEAKEAVERFAEE